MYMKIKSLKSYKPSKGEVISSESPFEPGLETNIKDVMIAFTRGGQVQNLNLKQPVYDPDEVVNQDDVDATVFDGHDVDLTDIESSAEYLTNVSTQQKEIQRLAAEYSTGRMSYDEFVRLANQQNVDLAKPYVERFGELLQSSSKVPEA